ncbi:MAG TPA: YggT family protein [Rudaea sp.]|jgi:YggT family protein|nr:YggT family protein [Rudaea sp.]
MSYLQNAGVFLIQTIFGLFIVMFLARAILIAISAPFTQPICRFVYQFTNPAVMPLRNVVPRWRRVDFASLLIAWLIAILELVCLFAIVGFHLSAAGTILRALVDIFDWLILIEIAVMLAVCVMSFIPSMRHDNNYALLLRITEPVVRPFRRLIPPMAGTDFSFFVASIVLILIRMLVIAPLTDLTSRIP